MSDACHTDCGCPHGFPCGSYGPLQPTPTSDMAIVSVRTGERFEVHGLPGDPNRCEKRVPTVEVWIGGKRFVHDCTTDQEAHDMVVHTMVDLGLLRV